MNNESTAPVSAKQVLGQVRSTNKGIEKAVAELEEIIVVSLRGGTTKQSSSNTNNELRRTNNAKSQNRILDSRVKPENDAQSLGSRVQCPEPKLVGLGDIGLDYHYQPVDKEKQKELLKKQLELAVKYDLPVQFHIRDAFDDFWPIFDRFKGLRGVLHCYTDNEANLIKALDRGLYISVNGISTFNRDKELEKAFDLIPLNKTILETDAPYLTPVEFRAKLNVPAYVEGVARYWANRCNCEITEVAKQTTDNATALFSLR